MVVAGWLFAATTVLAQSITTIELQGRSAAEIVPIVEPLLGPDDAVSGQGYLLVLRASPQTVAQVREFLSRVDTAPRSMQISVFQGTERDLKSVAASAEIRIESGDSGIEIGESSSAGSTSYSTTDASASVSARSTQRSLRDNPIHRVRATEGMEAYIATGTQIPYFVGGIGGRRVNGGIVEYQDALTGFYVVPLLRGDSVVFEVSAFKNSPPSGRDRNINIQNAITTVSGPIGSWVLVGGTSEQMVRTQSGIASTTTTRNNQHAGIWIKADLVE